jgi:chromosome partitioning protein
VRVIAILSRKGGTAKSTTARSLAVQAAINGHASAILDLDPQATSVLWAGRRPHPAPTVEALGERQLTAVLAAMRGRGAQRVFLDTAPHNQPLMNLATVSADACIITTGTGPDEVEQVGPVVEIVRKVGKPVAILLCRTQPRTSALVLARAALSAFGVPIIPTAITQTIVHVYAAAEGLTASEREPKGKAADEIAQAYKWIEGTLLNGAQSGELPDTGKVTRIRGART